ncbi:hypothetical protein BC829DRAFT_440280 [Chytridium lagenaria]|nr:hypothetical protein BC829DRAFT_440280 [Chytridium lagenaria]
MLQSVSTILFFAVAVSTQVHATCWYDGKSFSDWQRIIIPDDMGEIKTYTFLGGEVSKGVVEQARGPWINAAIWDNCNESRCNTEKEYPGPYGLTAKVSSNYAGYAWRDNLGTVISRGFNGSPVRTYQNLCGRNNRCTGSQFNRGIHARGFDCMPNGQWNFAAELKFMVSYVPKGGECPFFWDLVALYTSWVPGGQFISGVIGLVCSQQKNNFMEDSRINDGCTCISGLAVGQNYTCMAAC